MHHASGNAGRRLRFGTYVECSHKYMINHGVMVGGRQPSVEDDLHWKMTSIGRQTSVGI